VLRVAHHLPCDPVSRRNLIIAERGMVRMTRDIVAAVNRAWRDAHLLLCCTLDGVLTDRGDQPGDVWVPPSRRALVASLASQHAATVCVVSGRRLVQAQAIVGRDRRVHYVGLHGLEIEGPALSFFHLGAARAADGLTPLVVELHGIARETPGMVVEHRNLYLAARLSWVQGPGIREVAVSRVLERAAPFVRTHRLRVMTSGADIEFLPEVGWTTGHALREIRLATEREHGRCVTVALGHGGGHDEVFDSVNDSGIAVLVGDGTGPAVYRVSGGDEVDALLLGLVKMGHGKVTPDARTAL